MTTIVHRCVQAVAASAMLMMLAACSTSGSSATSETSSTRPPSGQSTASPTPELPISGKGWIAYQGPGSTGDDRFFLVHIDGSGDHAIARQLPGSVSHPDFSRDGSHLVFDQLASGDANSQVFVANADGSNIRHIAPCAPPSCLDRYAPSWSPDGKQLAISTDGGTLTATGPTQIRTCDRRRRLSTDSPDRGQLGDRGPGPPSAMVARWQAAGVLEGSHVERRVRDDRRLHCQRGRLRTASADVLEPARGRARLEPGRFADRVRHAPALCVLSGCGVGALHDASGRFGGTGADLVRAGRTTGDATTVDARWECDPLHAAGPNRASQAHLGHQRGWQR